MLMHFPVGGLTAALLVILQTQLIAADQDLRSRRPAHEGGGADAIKGKGLRIMRASALPCGRFISTVMPSSNWPTSGISNPPVRPLRESLKISREFVRNTLCDALTCKTKS